MSSENTPTAGIATSSLEEGLDFAFHLFIETLASAGNAIPAKAPEILNDITSYVHLRYVGELGLAFEYLEDLAREYPMPAPGNSKFNTQLNWISGKIGSSK